MSEYEEAREQYFSGQRSITNLIQAADAEITRLKEAEAHFIRMSVLAAKHCPQDHRDFEEIKSIIKAIDNKQG